MKMEKRGAFVVSLDFELFWGVADIANVSDWDKMIAKVHEIVPRTLNLFEKYGIHATWATVAGIMLHDERELKKYLPETLPTQTKEIMDKLYSKEVTNSVPAYMLFGPQLVDMIKDAEGQEIGTHTFTHYYCDKNNAEPLDFANELNTASTIMADKGLGMCRSVVFPRNQLSARFVDAIPESIQVYRGAIPGYIDKMKKKYSKLGTVVWYLDHYLPLQDSTFHYNEIKEKRHDNVKLSRLFKAYKAEYKFAEFLKIWRYKKEMRQAAKQGKIYHICWHPHNFSMHTEENFRQLEELLIEYQALKEKYGMISYNMYECAQQKTDIM